MDCPRHLPPVMITMLILTITALIAYRVPLPWWAAAICIAELLACGASLLVSACADVARLLHSAGRHVRSRL